MPNEQYQSLLALDGPTVRDRFTGGVPADAVAVIADVNDSDLKPLVTDLGGHDLQALLDACGEADRDQDRPTAVFPYTVKGWGLPIAGDPRTLRLCTRPIDQTPFEAVRARLSDAVLRRQVLSCAHRLVDAWTASPRWSKARDYGTAMPVVHLAASGAVIPEVPRS